MLCKKRYVWHVNDRVTSRDERRLGGKAMGLYRLSALNVSVPRFVVISTAVFEATLEPHREALAVLLSGIERDQRETLEFASARIQELIATARIHPRIQSRIEKQVATDFTEDESIAVRSSIVGEDSSAHSFAGQMESLLNVPRSQVIEAVRKVWASAFSSRALIYRLEKGLPLRGTTAAVIVQRMIRAQSSGVVFSRDPRSQERRCIITAGYGLGEGTVHDLVETDTYRVDCESGAISADISPRKRKVSCRPKAGTRVEAVPARLRSRSVLTDGQVRQVAQTAREIEARLGCPQDIEWAFDANGLHVLQARPIVFPTPKTRSNVRVWDNSNIVESYPGLTLPLTFSFVRQCYAVSFRRAVEGFLLFRREIQDDAHIFAEMLGLMDGRIYYNLLNWYKMLSYLPDFRRYKQSWDQMIGITNAVPFPENRLSLPNRIYVWCMIVYRLLTVRSNARRFFRHFRATYRRYQQRDFAKFSITELVETYRAMQRAFAVHWHRTLYNDVSAIRYYALLGKLCGRWGLERFANLQNDLLCGEKDVESVQPIRSLLSICDLIRSKPRLVELFVDRSDTDVWSRIQLHPEFASLKAALNRHVATFGDRGLEELKLEKPTFRDRPERIIELLRSYLQGGTSCEQLARMEGQTRALAEARVRQTLRNPIKRALFLFVLSQTRRAVASRENMRFARSRLFGIARRLFRRLADLFVADGTLNSREDFYYLTLPEVFNYLGGTSATQNLRRLVELRREEYVGFAARTLPQRIQTVNAPYPVPVADELEQASESGTLRGVGCSSGVVEGTAWVVSDPQSADRAGDYVLVAESTDPGWVFLMIRARGVVVERGSVLSHTAIIGRELGIPTVVGVPAASTRIKDGDRIWINGSTGEVRCG